MKYYYIQTISVSSSFRTTNYCNGDSYKICFHVHLTDKRINTLSDKSLFDHANAIILKVATDVKKTFAVFYQSNCFFLLNIQLCKDFLLILLWLLMHLYSHLWHMNMFKTVCYSCPAADI